MESLREEASDLVNRDLGVIEDELAVAGSLLPLAALVEVQVGTIVGEALGVHAVQLRWSEFSHILILNPKQCQMTKLKCQINPKIQMTKVVVLTFGFVQFLRFELSF
jgi:hypothetical protein